MIQAPKYLDRGRIAAIAVGVLGLVAAMPASASDNLTVTVNANVIGVCKFFLGPYTITVANSGSDIDPSLATTATGTVNIEYRCSNGQSPTFTVPASVTLGGAGSMDATISYTGGGAGTGMGSGQGKTLAVTGQIAQAEFQNKPVGAYTNTISVLVNP
jgi:hypothetical protein